MLVADDIESRLFGALANLDRRSFLLGGVSSAAVLHSADAQLMTLGIGSGAQGGGAGQSPVALAGLAPSPSINFTDGNEGLSLNQVGVQFPSLATNAPASNGMQPWYVGFSFTIPIAMTAGVLNVVGQAGGSPYSGGSTTSFFFTTNGTLNLVFNYGGMTFFNTGVVLVPGQSYTIVHGVAAPTAGTPPFFFITIVDSLGNVVFNKSSNTYNNYYGSSIQTMAGLGAAVVSTR